MDWTGSKLALSKNETARSLQAALLTDAQLVSDCHSSLVFNGARAGMKAWGPLMYEPSSRSSLFLLGDPVEVDE